VRITHLTLRNVRCFESYELDIDKPLVVIEGDNGSGKSTLIEALYYACYLKSFRTHRINDLARHSNEHSFFIKIHGISAGGDAYTIQIGFEDGIKKIKVNDTVINAYKELIDYYQVVAMSEYDMRLIQEGPEERRSFINQLTVLQEPHLVELLRQHKHIVSQRNQLLIRHQSANDDYIVWTKQLWDSSTKIREARKRGLALLESEINQIIATNTISIPPITLQYKPKEGAHQSFDEFWNLYQHSGYPNEQQQRRTLFGAHLDDITINWQGQNARLYASRGQQKLIVLLIKCAMIRVLQHNTAAAQPTITFLLDDFITDLDQAVANTMVDLIQSLNCSVIVTCPLKGLITFSAPFQHVFLRQNERQGDVDL